MNKTPLPKLSISAIRKILITFFLLLFVFVAGYQLGNKQYVIKTQNSRVTIDKAVPDKYQDVDFSLFWKVWDTLGESYFDKSKLISGKMVYGAIQGMVSAVGDPYTVFLPPDENKVVQEDLQGSFSGVGIQIGYKGTQLAVIAPLPGSPAEKAGVKAGDYIVGLVDQEKGLDTTTAGMSLPDAVQAIRGKAGSKIKLVLLREGDDEAFEVDVQREDIDVPSVILTFEGDQKEIAHIKLMKFVSETDGDWNNTVSEILTSNAKYVVLDLRNNPGGYLQGSVDIAGDFLPQGTLVVKEEGPNDKEEFKTSKLPKLAKYKTVVVINGGSASASEILTGALSEQLGIKTVGEKSFGKGTIQEPRQINGGSGLHITIAKWLTPKGNWVNEKGIEPDVKIEDNPDTEEDEQLLKAFEVVKS